jgi:beta-lactamase superfamily II metal-dependent hydrolase
MFIEIFDVEHGACALVTTSNGGRVLIDAGHNSTTGWRPGTHLLGRGIRYLDRLYVTNFDEDHASGYPNLVDCVTIGALFKNPTVPPTALRYIKREDGIGKGIDRLAWSMENTFVGGPAPELDFGDTVFTAYNNSFAALPVEGYFTDENNLSLVVFVRCGPHKFIFPGDMERPGWRQLLRNQAFRSELATVSVFVASHHGRESGYCEEVMNLCPSIELVLISDQKTGFQSQETLDDYRKHVRGINYNGTWRRVLTTRRDGYMYFNMPADSLGKVVVSNALAA